jgi:hypothetical protein
MLVNIDCWSTVRNLNPTRQLGSVVGQFIPASVIISLPPLLVWSQPQKFADDAAGVKTSLQEQNRFHTDDDYLSLNPFT